MSCAVVTIDLQYEFVDPAGSGAGHFEKGVCVPAVRSLVRAARRYGHRVIHVRSIHDGPDTVPRHLQAAFPSGYCLRGSPGAELLEGLAVDGELVIEKHQFSAFAGTALSQQLARMRRVVLAGLSVDCCVLATAFDVAVETGAELLVPYQAVSATNSELYLAALEMISKSLGAVVDLRELLDGGESFSASPLHGDSLHLAAGGWIRRQLAEAAIISQGAATSEQVRARVDALLAELPAFEASSRESPLPANE